ADTIVLCGGVRMGKPAGEEEARTMLERLSGRDHEVVTGIALVAPPNVRIVEAESTRVFFREITAGEIGKYIATGEPFDKAGAYAIQGYAAAFIDRIEGDYFNVVGLPVALLFRMLRRLDAALAPR
ncbi:MAG: Maf family protein, partial [Candidatus Krumholzibacteria bacterium]|nr:Maf family protein [Candidatus Krumholzibacteria bacterium]